MDGINVRHDIDVNTQNTIEAKQQPTENQFNIQRISSPSLRDTTTTLTHKWRQLLSAFE